MTCHPDVTANTAPTLKNKATFFDDVGYPVAVRIQRSRVRHRAGALLAASRVRRTLIIVRAIASHIPPAIDGARLGRVSVRGTVVANLPRVDDAVAAGHQNADVALAPLVAGAVAIVGTCLAGARPRCADPAGANRRFIGLGAWTGSQRVAAHASRIVTDQCASDAVVGRSAGPLARIEETRVGALVRVVDVTIVAGLAGVEDAVAASARRASTRVATLPDSAITVIRACFTAARPLVTDAALADGVFVALGARPVSVGELAKRARHLTHDTDPRHAVGDRRAGAKAHVETAGVVAVIGVVAVAIVA